MSDLGNLIHVAMTVSDMERSIEFYKKNFNFKLLDELLFTAYENGFFAESDDSRELYKVEEGSDCKVALLEEENGSMILELFQFRPLQPAQEVPWNRVGITHIAFSTDHFTELYERLVANGADFLMRPGTRVADGLHWVFLRDPDGNMIELLGKD